MLLKLSVFTVLQQVHSSIWTPHILTFNLTTNFKYTEPITPHWTTAAQELFKDIKQAILLDPFLQRFKYQWLIALQSDFLSWGFGYVVCQPGNDTSLTKAMNAYHSGTDFSFITKTSSAILHPVAFGARRCRGNKVRLHSHLGEGFAGDLAMSKCCHILFGQCFVWVTDSYAIKFICMTVPIPPSSAYRCIWWDGT